MTKFPVHLKSVEYAEASHVTTIGLIAIDDSEPTVARIENIILSDAIPDTKRFDLIEASKTALRIERIERVDVEGVDRSRKRKIVLIFGERNEIAFVYREELSFTETPESI